MDTQEITLTQDSSDGLSSTPSPTRSYRHEALTPLYASPAPKLSSSTS